MRQRVVRWFRRIRYGRPVIVVSGLPRSGTSLMMQMLHAGGLEVVTDGVRTPDESNPRGYFELEAVKDLGRTRDPDWLPGARGRAVKIVSSLLKHLPSDFNYQVIFMRRDLDEVVASQDRMLARGGAPPAGTGATASNVDAPATGTGTGANVTQPPASLEQKYATHLDHVMRMLQRESCFHVLDVSYRHVIDEPEATARRVAAFLGRRLDVAGMARASDAALYRNRNPSGAA